MLRAGEGLMAWVVNWGNVVLVIYKNIELPPLNH